MGSWYHVVGTYDGATLRLYLDGAEIASEADTRPAKAKTTPLFMGAAFGFGALRASVDEVAIYEHALVASRIVAHYKTGR